MGVEQSRIPQVAQKDAGEFLKDYQLLEKLENDTQVVKNKSTGEQLAMKEFSMTDEIEFQKIYDKNLPKTKLDHQNIVRILCNQTDDQKFLQYDQSLIDQHNIDTIYILFRVPEAKGQSIMLYLLQKQEVQNRLEINQPFSEDELWNILTQCILGLSYLYQHGVSHANIRPSTIYITNDGIVKVAEPSLLSQLPMYADAISQQKNIPPGIYLPPELLSAMYQQDYNPQYNQQKSDVFSLGMTALHAALLLPQDSAYNYKNCTIDEGIILQNLNKVKEKYGQNLSKFLFTMLVMDPAERQDINFFHSFLNQSQLSNYNSVQSSSVKQQPQSEYEEKRLPANPNIQNTIDLAPVSQSLQLQHQTDSGNHQSNGMIKDENDIGSKLGCVPSDREAQLCEPDENIGNGIGDYQGESEQQSTYLGSANNQNVPYAQEYIAQAGNNFANNTIKQVQTFPTPVNLSNQYVIQQQPQQANSYSYTSSSTVPFTNNLNQQSQIPIQQKNTTVTTNATTTIPVTTTVTNYTYNPSTSTQYNPISIDEAIRRSAPPPIRQEYLLSGGQNIQQVSSVITQSPPFVQQPSYPSSTISSSRIDPYKQSQEIESILAKYRQQPLNPTQGTSSSFSTVTQVVQKTSTQPQVSSYQIQPQMPNLTSQFGQLGINSNLNQQQPYSTLEGFKLQQNVNPGAYSNTNYGYTVENKAITTTSSSFQQKEYVIENYQNDSRYEGEKVNGMRHGYGKFFYQDGGLFEGQWKENKMHGKGVLSYASGKPAYDGEWVDDKFDGFGILYNENPAELRQPYNFSDFDNVDEYWTKYEGNFRDDNKEGHGTLFLSNGEKFIGTFDKDFVNGPGTYYPLGRQSFQGNWIQNKLQQ